MKIEGKAKKTLHTRLMIWGSHRRFIWWLLSPSVSVRLPNLPKFAFRLLNAEPPIGSRSLAIPPLPKSLVTVPGIPRDPEAERAAFEAGPLPLWPKVHAKAIEWFHHYGWTSHLLTNPMQARSRRQIANYKASALARPAASTSSDLTRHVKERAAQLGLSAVGVARYDRKYTFAPFLDTSLGSTVIVGALEQNWIATQQIPSLRSELAHHVTYARMDELMMQLANYVRELGFSAMPGGSGGPGVTIHYAVEAGLGQLGLNGQLLTPFAGSRCRLMLMHTDAPLTADTPVDYGVPAICDSCQACVRRCPSGAITNKRQWHRGVFKAKIKMDRCMPMVAQAMGCAVCMKVCPVQRYGLPAVIEEFSKTGRILGKNTDELEGYVWPVDGRRYGPGEKPRDAVSYEMLHPIGLDFDADFSATPVKDSSDELEL